MTGKNPKPSADSKARGLSKCLQSIPGNDPWGLKQGRCQLFSLRELSPSSCLYLDFLFLALAVVLCLSLSTPAYAWCRTPAEIHVAS